MSAQKPSKKKSIEFDGRQLQEITIDQYAVLMKEGRIIQRTLPIVVDIGDCDEPGNRNIEYGLDMRRIEPHSLVYPIQVPEDVNGFMVGEAIRGNQITHRFERFMPVVFYTVK